ncbi:NAD(+)/NADH kinase [Bacteriovoracaceae bacterium]|nr:NAD(+)/NADH kinase [Bacteriovoracaceae bacterium]|tara:strand:- start:196946 stop:197854 length:909 start_codon:yes stop_codon:yes gene_type:complete
MKKKLSIKNVGIVLKPKRTPEFRNIVPNICRWLIKRKVQINFLESDEERASKFLGAEFNKVKFLDHKHFLKDNDLIITLGGDGTFIGIARKCTKDSPPIFGINLGRLGFITEFSKTEYFDYLEDIFKSKSNLKVINLYKVEVRRDTKIIGKSFFINDAVINKNEISRMLSLTVENKDDMIYRISGDGLIVSSPIGSTAYSLAAGGPIIHPDVNGLVLTPICPHSLNHRPLVLSDKESISIKVPKNSDNVILTLDGQEAIALESRDLITITRSKTRKAKMILNPNRTYFEVLKEKFTHGKREF